MKPLLNQEEKFPSDSRELVEMLEKEYPPRCKRLKEDPEEHQQYAGKVSLIQWLRDWINRTDGNEDTD